MTLSLGKVAKGVLNLGIGEFLARLCTIATIVLVGHRYGAAVVGVFTLGMTISFYVQPVIDFGLRHIGARLMAQYPHGGMRIMHRVQRRRLTMSAAVLPLTLAYALLAKLPAELKLWLFLFSTTGSLYALSLEWAAWGKEKLRLVGASRATGPLGILVALAVGWHSQRVLWWIMLGNAVGLVSQALIFRVWWTRLEHDENITLEESRDIDDALALRRTSVMALSTFCTLAFSSIDMLMLGVMYNSAEVGIYSAAYRILNQVLVTYYLLTSVIYPHFARQTLESRRRSLSPRILLALAVSGVILALLLAAIRRSAVLILFGSQFIGADKLLLILIWAIPFDFVTSYLNAAFIAWGMEKKVLVCMSLAAGSNIVLNLMWIPRYGSVAAAINTILCYAILLGSLAISGYTTKELVLLS